MGDPGSYLASISAYEEATVLYADALATERKLRAEAWERLPDVKLNGKPLNTTDGRHYIDRETVESYSQVQDLWARRETAKAWMDYYAVVARVV